MTEPVSDLSPKSSRKISRDSDTDFDCKYIKKLLANTLNDKHNETSAHNLTLFSLVCAMKPKSILELGVRSGVSTLALLAGCELTKSRLTSVDIKKHRFDCPSDLQKYWTFVEQDALKFLRDNKKNWDMVLIDDWHSSRHVFRELCLLKPMLDNKTVVLLHDLMHGGSDPMYNLKVYPAEHQFGGTGPHGGVVRFVKRNPGFEFATIPTCHGLTILRKGTNDE